MHSLMFARNMTRDYGTELESRVFKMSAALVLLLLVRGISAATIRYVEHTHWTPKIHIPLFILTPQHTSVFHESSSPRGVRDLESPGTDSTTNTGLC